MLVDISVGDICMECRSLRMLVLVNGGQCIPVYINVYNYQYARPNDKLPFVKRVHKYILV